MKRLIEIESALDARITEVIQKKQYKDFQQFAEVALENQVIAENGAPDVWGIGYSSDENIQVAKSSDPNLLKINKSDIKIFEAPSDSDLVGRILWGQYYRFLPVKLAVRVLANMSRSNPPLLEDFLDEAVKSAVSIRTILSRLDKKMRTEFGERLAASFPEGSEKSIKRFKSHFLVYPRRTDSRLDGFLPRLKLANVRIQSGEERVGLTESGRKFSLLSNPVIDDGEASSLSKQECEFLINHFLDNLPNEANHMYSCLAAIAGGSNTREPLNSSLRKYYNSYHDGQSWSDEVINTMRVGLIGRLLDLGLIDRKKKGTNVSYYPTGDGQKFVNAFAKVSGASGASRGE